MKKANEPKPKKSLLHKGVNIFLIGFIVLAVFVAVGIGGILRELARLSVIVGLVIIIVGAIKKLFTKTPT